jgi:hypothetical protein
MAALAEAGQARREQQQVLFGAAARRRGARCRARLVADSSWLILTLHILSPSVSSPRAGRRRRPSIRTIIWLRKQCNRLPFAPLIRIKNAGAKAVRGLARAAVRFAAAGNAAKVCGRFFLGLIHVHMARRSARRAEPATADFV